MIIIVTQSGSSYELRSDVFIDMPSDTLYITRVSDSEVYDYENKDVTDDVNNYLAHEPILEMDDPPMPGERWTLHTKHGRLQTSPVAYVNYAREDGTIVVYDDEVERYEDEI